VLLAAGALVVAGALAVGVTSRAGARGAFRLFLDSDDAAIAEHLHAVRPQVAAALDRACCDAAQIDAASARLGPDLALFVFDEASRAPLGMAGAPLVRLRDVTVRSNAAELVVEADRAAEGGSSEHLSLRFQGAGVPIALADGRRARVHVVPIQGPLRVRAAVAVLAPLDGRAIAVALALALCGVAAAWLTAWRTARAARDIEAALRDIAEGRLDRRVVPGGPGETADLGRAFNTMADALQRRAPSSEEAP
jgi:methyl-accepting chemotaxis protein